jgi:hypothetical protein
MACPSPQLVPREGTQLFGCGHRSWPVRPSASLLEAAGTLRGASRAKLRRFESVTE